MSYRSAAGIEQLSSTIYLPGVPGYDVDDIGPALQIALDTLYLAGSSGGTVRLARGNQTLITPVSCSASEGQQVVFEGVRGDTVLILDGEDTDTLIFVGHDTFAATGASFTLRDMTVRTKDVQTFSCAHFLSTDMSANGFVNISNVAFWGIYAKQSVVKLEDGYCSIENVQFNGCLALGSNGHGMLELFEVYHPLVRNVTHLQGGTFQGVSYVGESTAAVIEWQAPQVNFSNNVYNGNLWIDGCWFDSQTSYPILINNKVGSTRGGIVKITDCKITSSGVGSNCIFAKSCNQVVVDGIFLNGSNDVTQNAIELYDIGEAIVRNFRTKPASVNLIFAADDVGTLLVEDSTLVGNTAYPAGINSAATVTTVRKGGIEYRLRACVGAVADKTLAKISATANKVAQLGTSDSVKKSVGVFGCAGADGSLVLVAEKQGQTVPVLTDATAVTIADAITASATSAGRVATEATGGNPACGRAYSGDAGGAGEATIQMYWSKEAA